MLLARGFCCLEDLRGGEPQLVAPTLDVQPGWPALPPARQGGCIEAQRVEQLAEKLIRDRRARLRVLLLLYWFT